MAGKGDKARNNYSKEFKSNFDKINWTKTVNIPLEPEENLINDMCFKYNHAFWIDKMDDHPLSSGLSERDREFLRKQMRELYQQVIQYYE